MFQACYDEITKDPSYVDQILSEGASKAGEIADQTLNNVYQAMGFLRRWVDEENTTLNDAKFDS